MWNMCECASKLPQNSILQNKSQPKMLLPGHPGEVHWYKQHFWTNADFFDLGQQADLYTKSHRSAENVKNYDMDVRYPADLCHIYCIYFFFIWSLPIYIVSSPLKLVHLGALSIVNTCHLEKAWHFNDPGTFHLTQ